jgi:hypothetical protein
LQSSCVLQAAIVGKFFFACAHLTRGRCCTSNLIAPYLVRFDAVAVLGGDREWLHVDYFENDVDSVRWIKAADLTGK